MQDQSQKRQYLRQQIIDDGYDPQDFSQFLMTSSTTDQVAPNINQWTLPQLKNLVAQFKALRKPQKKNSQSENRRSIIYQQENQSEKKQSKPKKQQFIHRETEYTAKTYQVVKQSSVQYHSINLQTKQQVFSQVVNCQTAVPSTLFSAKNVTINISKYDKKQGGIFEQSYVVYYVTTPFLKKTVDRRYSDFLWLKQTLQALHPGLPIPPIAKKGQFRRYDDKHLSKRMLILEKFLNKLLQIPQIKGDQIFENFLKFDDFVMFQKFKSEYHKLPANIPLHKIRNIKGKLTLSIQPKINNYLAMGQRNLIDSHLQIKRIFKEFKAAATCLEGASAHLNQISKVCKSLNAKQFKFRKETDTKYFPTNMYTLLEELTQKYSDILEKQAKTFRNQVYSTIKYEYLNTVNLIEAFDKLVVLQKSYSENRNALQKKKQRLYEQGIISKWGAPQLQNQSSKPPKGQAMKLMLPKQTHELIKQRETFALYNFTLYEQLNRHYAQNSMYLSDYFNTIARLHSEINSESMMLWVDVLTKISAIKEGKNINNSDVYLGK